MFAEASQGAAFRPGWIHEIKHDDFRIMARRDAAGVRQGKVSYRDPQQELKRAGLRWQKPGTLRTENSG